jgi:hypothetical protein
MRQSPACRTYLFVTCPNFSSIPRKSRCAHLSAIFPPWKRKISTPGKGHTAVDRRKSAKRAGLGGCKLHPRHNLVALGDQILDFGLDVPYGIIPTMNTQIIGVRFTKVGKIYHFDTPPCQTCRSANT